MQTDDLSLSVQSAQQMCLCQMIIRVFLCRGIWLVKVGIIRQSKGLLDIPIYRLPRDTENRTVKMV